MRPEDYYQSWTDPGGAPAGVFGPPPPYRPRWWLHGLLFALTLATTTFWGAALFSERLPTELASLPLWRWPLDPTFVFQGLEFSLPLLAILTCHELGHYFACRAHGLLATPPFFIPFPLPIGTLGAVIRIKQPIRSRSELMDVGAAGPVSGFVALLPFLVYGIATAHVGPLPREPVSGFSTEFAKPLIFRAIEALTQPSVGTGSTLFMNPVLAAAWFGLLVTLLNLLPFAQLDGGHICYALLGRWHRRITPPLLALLVVGGFFWYGWWLWAVIVLILRVHHPPVADEQAPLGGGRVVIGLIALVIFILSFMPDPVRVAQ